MIIALEAYNCSPVVILNHALKTEVFVNDRSPRVARWKEAHLEQKIGVGRVVAQVEHPRGRGEVGNGLQVPTIIDWSGMI